MLDDAKPESVGIRRWKKQFGGQAIEMRYHNFVTTLEGHERFVPRYNKSVCYTSQFLHLL